MNFRAFLEHNIGSVTQVSRAEINGFSHVGNLKKNENKYREDNPAKLLTSANTHYCTEEEDEVG